MSDDVLHVPVDHAAFGGHFPGAPLLPGALLLDEVAARVAPAGAILRFSAVKFRRPVLPGTTLHFRIEPSAAGWRFAIEDSAGRVAEGAVTPA
jgi:3-hydroxyacyl-[acyl-carrier-protein] dehydratase